MLSVKELTEKAIAEELEALAGVPVKSSLMNVFRDNYDTWTDDLFPILKAHGKGCYSYISDLLEKAGYGSVSESQIGGYFHAVRKERKAQSKRGA